MYSKLPIFNKSIIKNVLILLPLHREGLTSYLSPLLGQYGLRNIDFVTNFVSVFNEKTSGILEENIKSDDIELGLSDEVLTVPIYMTVYKNGKYELDTGYSLIGFLYKTTFKKYRRFFKNYRFYRNYKKILQLVFFKYYIFTAMNKKNYINNVPLYNITSISLEIKNVYKEIRNSLHRKR